MLAGKPQLLFRRSRTLSIPICLETVTLALPFLGEIHLIARILLDGFVRTLCQRCRRDRDQEGKEDNESEHAHLYLLSSNFGLYCVYQINLTRVGSVSVERR
jgi:hypothetical protein